MVNPLATLSCGDNFVGYQMILLENLEWYQFPLHTKSLEVLKKVWEMAGIMIDEKF